MSRAVGYNRGPDLAGKPVNPGPICFLRGGQMREGRLGKTRDASGAALQPGLPFDFIHPAEAPPHAPVMRAIPGGTSAAEPDDSSRILHHISQQVLQDAAVAPATR